jgi:hypothetical protein
MSPFRPIAALVLTAAATAPLLAQAQPTLAKREPGKLTFGSAGPGSSLVSASECVSNVAEQSPGNDCTWPGLPVRNRARKLTVGTMAWPAKGCFPLLS